MVFSEDFGKLQHKLGPQPVPISNIHNINRFMYPDN